MALNPLIPKKPTYVERNSASEREDMPSKLHYIMSAPRDSRGHSWDFDTLWWSILVKELPERNFSFEIDYLPRRCFNNRKLVVGSNFPILCLRNPNPKDVSGGPRSWFSPLELHLGFPHPKQLVWGRISHGLC
ncbi:hypothetical protein JTB14_009316 [Gonioctena quinquepunctata]|nr:hypothetical protein JTB14_009316 [Gonioctena quinquepunctata]